MLGAPFNLRSRRTELIQREIEHQQNGEQGRLIFKMNQLVDKPMIKLLYQASQAGVQIDLIVRGICCMRPGLKGISENVRIVSIVGRYLEHSRIYYFRNAGNEEVYMGSADLMPRNLNRRVEVVIPVESPQIIRHIHDDVLQTYLSDNLKARVMQPDGTYRRLQPEDNGKPPLSAQDWFMKSRQAIHAR
jgi:polyphosphate kinase